MNVWLQSRSLPARWRVGLEVHRCLCIIDAGNIFISTVGEEQLVSCAAEQSKYCSICTVTLDPCGVTNWGRWQCRRGGRRNKDVSRINYT